jgi:quercetin dioxygenase-like cupin family protein
MEQKMKIRRVVTGHKQDGKATVIIDEISTDMLSFRQGANVCNIWSTDSLPVNNEDEADGAKRIVGTATKNGSVFRVIEYQPGVTPRNHRTDSIDYAIILDGEIDMELDDECVRLRKGDVLVQRGTIHNWINRSDKSCFIAFVLIDALPYAGSGRQLNATG